MIDTEAYTRMQTQTNTDRGKYMQTYTNRLTQYDRNKHTIHSEKYRCNTHTHTQQISTQKYIHMDSRTRRQTYVGRHTWTQIHMNTFKWNTPEPYICT
jgi:hypothetical protein